MHNMEHDNDRKDSINHQPHEQCKNQGSHTNANHGEHKEPMESHMHMNHDQHAGDHSAMSNDYNAVSSHSRHTGHSVEAFRKRFWISLITTVPILLLTPQIQEFLGIGVVFVFPGQNYVLFALSSFVYFYGGYPFLQGLVREFREKLPGMMTLIGVAITVSYVYSSATVFGLPGMPFFWELATLIDIMLLGHWLEMKSITSASIALEELARLMPSMAHKLESDGNVIDTPLNKLVVGDRALVKPGEKIPADGVVVDGNSTVNEAMLTGESKPVRKTVNAEVVGGSVNGEGSLTVEVKKTGKDSFLSQVIDLVRKAKESKSRAQDLSNRVAFWLTIIALAVGFLTFVMWGLVIKESITFSLERAVTVMVITCPHALGLAVPLVVAISTAIAAKSGLLIRNRSAFENARCIDAIILDKTGTLTEGRFGVTDVVAFDNKTDDSEILQYAASIEAYSEHPIAKGITGATKERFTANDFKNIMGEGAQALVNGKDVKVVSPEYVKKRGIVFPESDIDRLSGQGKTVVVLLIDNEAISAIALADIVRPESKQAIGEIKSMGVKTIMMTGDNKQVAKWVSDELDLDEYFAEVLPQEKAAKVKEVQSRGLIVAMTGDGVNDAPALAQADVGIAIGSGTDVAVETADIVLVRSNPLDVLNVIKLARSTYTKMIQNLVWATGYNTFAIPLAAGVFYSYGIILSPAIGAVFMSASTIIVAFNARLLRLEK